MLFLNASAPIVVLFAEEILITSTDVQSLNAYSLIVATLSGILISVKLALFSNALTPISVQALLETNVNVVEARQSLNALSEIVVICPGILISASFSEPL